MATSMALRATSGGGTGGWQEGLALPDAAPGSGALELTAGVGYLPAVVAGYEAVAAQFKSRWACRCAHGPGIH